jgi:hypothetical protein
MRTFENIIKDYLSFMYTYTKDDKFIYGNFIENYKTIDIAHSIAYKAIIDKCYDKENGMFYFSKFIIGDLTDAGFPRPFRYNNLLRRWDKLIKKYKHLAILSARGHGKCLTGDTLITLKNGTRKKLVDMKPGDKIISLNTKTLKEEFDEVEYMKYVGDKVKYNIILDSGKEISVADTHKFLTIDGWKQLKDININEYIATPRKILIESQKCFNTNKDVIPIGLVQRHYHKKIFNNISRSKLKNIIVKTLQQQNSKNILHRKKALQTNIEKLIDLSESDIYWDKIISIEKDDIEAMYDIQVKKNHTYIANDIFTHNTIFFSTIYPLYRAFLWKNQKIILESASARQSEFILGFLKKVILNNEALMSKKIPNAKWTNEIVEYNGEWIWATGFGSEVRGGHVDLIVVDDILRSDNKLNDTQIENFLFEELEPMITDRNGQLILVGTPKSESDIFSLIGKYKKENINYPWKIEKFPAILDYDDKIVQCPDRFTFKQLMNKRLIQGPQKFEKEYQLQFYSLDASLFPPRIVQPALESGKDEVLLDFVDQAWIERNPNWSIYIGIDVARSGSVSADFTVALVLGYNYRTQEKKILHMFRAKGLKTTLQVERIAEVASKFNNPIILVEKNNIGVDFIDMMIDDYNLAVEEFTTTSKSKEDLIRFLINTFERGKMIIPQGNTHSKGVMEILVSELYKFCVTITNAGNEKYEGKGAHDDCVISLALANKATQLGGSIPFLMTEDDLYRKESDLFNQIQFGLIK